MNDLKTMALAAVSSFNAAKDHLFATVGKDLNSIYPTGISCRVEDLYMTFHVLLSDDEETRSSVLVTDKMLSSWGITKEQLCSAALENTAKLFPPQIGNLSHIVGAGVEDDKPPVLVLSTQDQMNGATALFYPGLVKKISYLVGGNYYVIPSSIHEVLISPEGYMPLNDLREMVRSVNDSGIVSEEDILSYNVYYYDAVAEKFSIAS